MAAVSRNTIFFHHQIGGGAFSVISGGPGLNDQWFDFSRLDCFSMLYLGLTVEAIWKLQMVQQAVINQLGSDHKSTSHN